MKAALLALLVLAAPDGGVRRVARDPLAAVKVSRGACDGGPGPVVWMVGGLPMRELPDGGLAPHSRDPKLSTEFR